MSSSSPTHPLNWSPDTRSGVTRLLAVALVCCVLGRFYEHIGAPVPLFLYVYAYALGLVLLSSAVGALITGSRTRLLPGTGSLLAGFAFALIAFLLGSSTFVLAAISFWAIALTGVFLAVVSASKVPA